MRPCHQLALTVIVSSAPWLIAAQLIVACASDSPAPLSAAAAASPAPAGTTTAAAPTTAAPAVAGAGASAVASPNGASGTPASAAAAGGSVAKTGNAATVTAGAAAVSVAGASGAPSAAAGGAPSAEGGRGAAGGGAGLSGSAGAAGSGAAGSGGGAAPAIDWSKREDLGEGDGSDVVTIGDSWMAGPLNGAGIQAGLDRAGTKYRHYAVTATTLLSGQIPGQYDQAKRANPKISTVIMTGGGNDVMFTAGSCSTPEACAMFSEMITAALNELWTKMADDGVKDVIYVQYSDSAGSTPQENRGKAKAVAPICMSGRLYCHVVPTSDIISSSDLADGIHPGTPGNDRIAKRTLMLMKDHKMRR